MRQHKMTVWDEGQVLIKASDTLFECAQELRETKPEYADRLYHAACEIGDIFNLHKSHVFGLRGVDECTCLSCDEAERKGENPSADCEVKDG